MSVFLLLSLSYKLLAQPPVAIPSQSYRQAQAAFQPAPPNLRWQGLTVTAPDGALWTGTAHGLWRDDPKAPAPDRKRYFSGRRWLPDNHVQALAPAPNGAIWAQTAAGTVRIELAPYTLAQKAIAFEARIPRHVRHGFVANTQLSEPGNLATTQTRSDDNDGLWTAMYAAAQAYRFSATRSPEARQRAEQSLAAIVELETVTGRPGLPARSFILPHETQPRDGIWYASPVRPAVHRKEVRWKADTSSDELVGHYYAFSVLHDHLPRGGPLHARMTATLRRITDHILQHDLTLTDIHGMPTWWGRWDAPYFRSERGYADAPLNALEILSFLKTAHHITADARYQQEYLRLAHQEGYAAITAELTKRRGNAINYSDEELAMLSFYPLLRYEKDPRLLAIYRDGLNQWWQNIQREKNPLWNAIYLASIGTPPPNARALLEDARWTLERIPMDLIDWDVSNQHRTDIDWEPQTDRHGRKQARTLLPPDERPLMRWNGNPFRTGGGAGGRREEDGVFFLLPYWMARAFSYFR
jgi:hypothetical protein